MLLKHQIGRSIELVLPGAEHSLWTYIYAGKPKPYFHPVYTPAGYCLTLNEPHDHIWHRGLWFTIKLINGENFWEERVHYGTQQTLAPPTIAHGPGDRIIVSSLLNWVRPDSTESVFHEQRQFAYQPLDAESYAIDFETTLTAQADLLLDRTPFTTWGGYGGLIVRGSRSWQNTRLLFSDGSTSDRPTGVRALWCDLSGIFDGGIEQTGGVAMFDHPDNPRYPSPWYGTTGGGHYFNAAFLFHEPMHLGAQESLAFRYRVLIHDHIWDQARLQTAYDNYLKG